MIDRNTILVRLQELDHEIAEVKKRLPAHSIKPPIMMELLSLEDERDRLAKELRRSPGDHD